MTTLRTLAVLVALASAVACQDSTDSAAEPSSSMPIRIVNAFPKQAKFEQPLYVGFHSSDPDYAYVVEQGGMVWRVARDAASDERMPFLEWKDQTFSGANWEEGLLGFAFDPSYQDNQFVYIYYTEKVSGEGKRAKRRSVISRLTKVDGFAGPTVMNDSELRILEVDQPYGNHNGGTIEFGPDGMLYVALGDGGRANDPHGNSQNKSTLLGSILRLDVRGANNAKPYQIPADNPFVGQAGVEPSIWSYGHRNPQGLAIDLGEHRHAPHPTVLALTVREPAVERSGQRQHGLWQSVDSGPRGAETEARLRLTGVQRLAPARQGHRDEVAVDRCLTGPRARD